jgi:excinuclease ABC subunit A
MKLLFARIGRTYSPISGQEVKKNSVTDVVADVESFEQQMVASGTNSPRRREKLEDKLKCYSNLLNFS